MRRGLWISLCMVMMLASGGLGRGVRAQSQGGLGQNPSPTVSHTGVGEPEAADGDPMKQQMKERMIVQANDARHKKLAADVDRMLVLTTELKTAVDKASKDELSLEVVRKAAEIEKLAHDVKEREKN